MVDLVHEKYSKIYFANKLSGAFCFCWMVYLIIFLVPLLIGFTSFCNNIQIILLFQIFCRVLEYIERNIHSAYCK